MATTPPPVPPLEMDRWGQGNSALTVFLAKQAVVAPEAIRYLLEALRDGRHLDKLPKLPPVGEWLKLYRDHWRMQAVILDALSPASDSETKTSVVIELAMRNYAAWARMSVEERRKKLEGVPPEELVQLVQGLRQLGREALQEQSAEIRADIAGEAPEDDDALRDRLWPTGEMQYYFRVWIPCMLLYGELPLRMMKRARHGDIDAICDLLRLDKLAIAEPRIAEEFAKAYTIKGRARFKRMTKALASPCKALTLGQIKSRLAGFISKTASAMGHPIEAPKIKDLFDATAKDYGNGLCDPHIPAGETLTKRLQRGRQFWHLIPDPPAKPDKSHT